MINNFSVLLECPLFCGISEAELNSLLNCLDARRQKFNKDQVILLAGEPVSSVGILLEGCARIVRDEITGDRTILAALEPGDLFAEAFACASRPDKMSGDKKTLPVTVITVAESAVLWIDCQKIIAICPSSCAFHGRLLANMLGVLADKNIQLNRKIGHLSNRSTRDKLLSYLSEQAIFHKSLEFQIPFNRQELADYLCVDRSAMSAALGKLRDEGLLEFHQNQFRLKNACKQAGEADGDRSQPVESRQFSLLPN